MAADLVLIVLGLALLAVGGELLVRGAVGLALRFRVTPAVIGLTMVAAGTSMPELVVSVLATLRGSPDIAVANVVGSNIFNIGLVLGLTALVTALAVESATLRLEWPFLLAVTVLVTVCMMDAELGLLEGLGFLVLLAAFLTVSVRRARRAEAERLDRALPSGPEDLPRAGGATGFPRHLAFTLAGFVLLVLGGRFVVNGAVAVALAFGLSERVVGLTIVAMGTSLPELASSLVAALRGRGDMAVGNVIGSNIFNLLGILGSAATVRTLAVNPTLASDVLWMVGFTLVLAPLIYMGRRRVSRADGLVLVVLFTVYMVRLVLTSGT